MPLEGHADTILSAIDACPAITIDELRALLGEQEVVASHGAVWNLHELSKKGRI